MKIVINKCYGGFGLSPKAIQEWAKLKNRECYFFSNRDKKGNRNSDIYYSLSLKEAEKSFMFSAFDIPNPNEILKYKKLWGEMTKKEKQKANNLNRKHSITYSDIERTDSDLIAVVEKLGEEADGSCAELKVVEIPDNIEWTIEEYDGIEWISEKHRIWE